MLEQEIDKEIRVAETEDLKQIGLCMMGGDDNCGYVTILLLVVRDTPMVAITL